MKIYPRVLTKDHKNIFKKNKEKLQMIFIWVGLYKNRRLKFKKGVKIQFYNIKKNYLFLND